MAFFGLLALLVALPQGAALAEEAVESWGTMSTVLVTTGNLGTGPSKSGEATADPSQAKITKEQAIAKANTTLTSVC